MPPRSDTARDGEDVQNGTRMNDTTTIDDVLAAREVRSVFQPIIDLDTGAVVAYEALARGPVGLAAGTRRALRRRPARRAAWPSWTARAAPPPSAVPWPRGCWPR